ncbi:MAG: thioredoxin family protein [Holosporaceae bacterium]|nr:thioredoxin family protein [Holosporaceae bacterium]
MQKIVSILAILLFFFDSLSKPIDNIGISVSYTQEKIKIFKCRLTLSIPEGWKLPKAPDISVLKSKNLKNFRYDGNFEQLDEVTYRISFTVVMENTLKRENALELQLDCPLCKDICTIVSQKVNLTLINKEISSISKIFILFIGFIGGLLLNAMPCILPIILMKLKSFGSKEAICGSIAGNYVGIAIFGAIIAFLKISGEAVGWGMHFQNPYFLEGVTIILFCLALYSFEIVNWFPSVRISNKTHREFFGNFLSNTTACMIAIPCTAPFLGTAATFAIQGSIADLCQIFFAIATGFSTPYFLATLLPTSTWAKLVPYGNTLKKIANYGVVVVFLWFFWLLTHHLSPVATKLYSVAFIMLAALLRKGKYSAAGMILLLSLVGWFQREFPNFSAKAMDRYENIETLLRAELSKKQIVIFNITADWCLTCKYNGRIFYNEKVIRAMKNNKVKFIEADMTQKSNALLRFINSHGRVGIPFTIVFGPRTLYPGILLGEILTADAMIAAIEKAKG